MKILEQKAIISRIARFVVSAALLLWLLRMVQFEELKTALYDSKWFLFIISTLIAWARLIVASCRWHIILAADSTNISIFRLFYWYMIASFFNIFLPTAMGGDIMRIYELAKYNSKKAEAVASVLMERILGLFALIGMATVALFLSAQARHEPRIYVSVLVISSVSFMVSVLLFYPPFSRAIIRFSGRVRLGKIGAKLGNAHNAFYKLQVHRKAIILAFSVSILFQVIGVFCIYLIGMALDINAPLPFYFLSLPIIYLVTMVPVSINGMGVREGAFVFFFTSIGNSTASALMLSFLSFAQLIATGLLGGILYIAHPWLYKSRSDFTPTI